MKTSLASSLNPGRIRLFSLLSVGLLAVSCLDRIPSMKNHHGNDDDDPSGGVERVEELEIRSVQLRPAENESIFGSVSFTPDASGTVWRATIGDYQTDLSALKVVFSAVADRVTVNGVEQISGVTVNDFRREVVFRLHTTRNEYRDFTLSVTNPCDGFGGFPVLAIVTDDEKPVNSKETWVSGRVVFDPGQSGYEPYSGPMSIKGRGHNTWGQPKKPYNLKLSEKVGFLGMNPHKRWTLLANAGDRTLMRNRVAYRLGRLTQLPWTPDTRYVEVILNGKFVGNYLLTEQIRVDKKRVDIVEAEAGMGPEEVGYLLEFDRYVEANYFYTTRRQLPVNIKEPDEKLLTPEQKTYISEYVERVEGMLYDGDTVDPAYRDLIDMDTFIDWWIVVELTENRDTKLPGSCHMYKDAGGRLCAGPLWDFDLTTFQGSTREFMQYDYEVDLSDPAHTNRNLWYKRLFSDPVFRARAKERWEGYKGAFEAVGDFIDEEKTALEASAARNWALWTIGAGANRDESLEWEDAVERLRTNYFIRLNWLDSRIAEW